MFSSYYFEQPDSFITPTYKEYFHSVWVTFGSYFQKKISNSYHYLTRSLNKRQTIRTMAQEVLMSHMAHVGLPQAQFAQRYF